MDSFIISLYVYPREFENVHFTLNLSLLKSFKPSKRFSAGFSFYKGLNEYVYKFSKNGITFKMVCRYHKGHLYFSRFYVYMFNEETCVPYEVDMIYDYSLYIYNSSMPGEIPLVAVHKDMPETAFNYLKLV